MLLNETDDKSLKKDPKKTARIAAMLVMANVFSKFTLDRQYGVYKAMKQTMLEKLDTWRLLGDSIDEIAASLVLSSEINKMSKK